MKHIIITEFLSLIIIEEEGSNALGRRRLPSPTSRHALCFPLRSLFSFCAVPVFGGVAYEAIFVLVLFD